MSPTIDACPECDAANVRTRSPATRGKTGRDEKHYCGECGASFDEPVERTRGPGGGIPGHTLAARLANAAHEPTLVTDGGRR